MSRISGPRQLRLLSVYLLMLALLCWAGGVVGFATAKPGLAIIGFPLSALLFVLHGSYLRRTYDVAIRDLLATKNDSLLNSVSSGSAGRGTVGHITNRRIVEMDGRGTDVRNLPTIHDRRRRRRVTRAMHNYSATIWLTLHLGWAVIWHWVNPDLRSPRHGVCRFPH